MEVMDREYHRVCELCENEQVFIMLVDNGNALAALFQPTVSVCTCLNNLPLGGYLKFESGVSLEYMKKEKEFASPH